MTDLYQEGWFIKNLLYENKILIFSVLICKLKCPWFTFAVECSTKQPLARNLDYCTNGGILLNFGNNLHLVSGLEINKYIFERQPSFNPLVLLICRHNA